MGLAHSAPRIIRQIKRRGKKATLKKLVRREEAERGTPSLYYNVCMYCAGLKYPQVLGYKYAGVGVKNGFAKGFAMEGRCPGFGIRGFGQWVKVGRFGGKRLGI